MPRTPRPAVGAWASERASDETGAGTDYFFFGSVSATVVMTSRAAVGPALRKKASSSTRTACLSLTALSPAHRGMAVSSVLFLSLSFSSFGVFCAP